MLIGCQAETVAGLPWAADSCPWVGKLRTVLPLSDVIRDSAVQLVLSSSWGCATPVARGWTHQVAHVAGARCPRLLRRGRAAAASAAGGGGGGGGVWWWWWCSGVWWWWWCGGVASRTRGHRRSRAGALRQPLLQNNSIAGFNRVFDRRFR
jgi:hypothetical protein